eukprot:GHVR01105016.1.p1 GENE.GHVR01105016.1~~GHVR01105016.1.p1  ORF type:complete len:616 (+),score=90.64 GHVR01105016.1:32-1879(+)
MELHSPKELSESDPYRPVLLWLDHATVYLSHSSECLSTAAVSEQTLFKELEATKSSINDALTELISRSTGEMCEGAIPSISRGFDVVVKQMDFLERKCIGTYQALVVAERKTNQLKLKFHELRKTLAVAPKLHSQKLQQARQEATYNKEECTRCLESLEVALEERQRAQIGDGKFFKNSQVYSTVLVKAVRKAAEHLCRYSLKKKDTVKSLTGGLLQTKIQFVDCVAFHALRFKQTLIEGGDSLHTPLLELCTTLNESMLPETHPQQLSHCVFHTAIEPEANVEASCPPAVSDTNMYSLAGVGKAMLDLQRASSCVLACVSTIHQVEELLKHASCSARKYNESYCCLRVPQPNSALGPALQECAVTASAAVVAYIGGSCVRALRIFICAVNSLSHLSVRLTGVNESLRQMKHSSETLFDNSWKNMLELVEQRDSIVRSAMEKCTAALVPLNDYTYSPLSDYFVLPVEPSVDASPGVFPVTACLALSGERGRTTSMRHLEGLSISRNSTHQLQSKIDRLSKKHSHKHKYSHVDPHALNVVVAALKNAISSEGLIQKAKIDFDRQLFDTIKHTQTLISSVGTSMVFNTNTQLLTLSFTHAINGTHRLTWTSSGICMG